MSRIAVILAALAVIVITGPSHAAELLVLEQRGCEWCAQFEIEIGPIYAKTREGRVAPLRRIDIDRPWPSDVPAVEHLRYTPTFVLIDGDKVVGRLEGYPGDNFFWPMIDDLIAKLPES